MTGRVIDDQPTIDYILKLHNEVRSKIGRGRCDQPKAGCMWPLVNLKNIFCFQNCFDLLCTVPLGDWLEKKNVTAIIIKQQFGFPMSTT